MNATTGPQGSAASSRMLLALISPNGESAWNEGRENAQDGSFYPNPDSKVRAGKEKIRMPTHGKGYAYVPWQCLYFLPEPQGQASLRPTLPHVAGSLGSRTAGARLLPRPAGDS